MPKLSRSGRGLDGRLPLNPKCADLNSMAGKYCLMVINLNFKSSVFRGFFHLAWVMFLIKNEGYINFWDKMFSEIIIEISI